MAPEKIPPTYFPIHTYFDIIMVWESALMPKKTHLNTNFLILGVVFGNKQCQQKDKIGCILIKIYTLKCRFSICFFCSVWRKSEYGCGKCAITGPYCFSVSQALEKISLCQYVLFWQALLIFSYFCTMEIVFEWQIM